MFLEILNKVDQPRLQLLCFPYGGAGASVFRKWATYLEPDIQLTGIQLPGRETKIKEPPFLSMKPLIRALVNSLSGDHYRLPFAFYGHSIGALIAFELAVALQNKGLPGPVHLTVSGCRAPHQQTYRSPINQLPDIEFIEAIRDLGGTPEEVLQNDVLMEVYLPILRSDFTLLENYVCESPPPLEIPILAFGGTNDQEVEKEQIMAWAAHTNNTFHAELFPGNHFFLEQHYQELIARMLKAISPELKN